MHRILLMSEIFPPRHGGSGRWFAEIYGRFPKENVVFWVGDHADAQEHDSYFEHPIYRDNLHSSEWGLRSVKGARYYLRLWLRLIKLVRQNQVTHIHCARVLPEGVPALMTKWTTRTPYSCYVHGEDVQTVMSSRELSFLTRLVMKHADRIICNSQNSAKVLKDQWGVPEAQITVINPGVDVSRFSPATSSEKPVAWDGKLNILTVGRLQKRKGQDMMIRALPELLRQFPNLQYTVIGGGKEKDYLQALAKEQGVSEHVLFMGEITDDEMVEYYRHCDLFALPNRRVGQDDEGFGMVLLEAQSCGRPVLAGRSGGTAETMCEGKTGITADCTTPESVAKAVSTLLENEVVRERLGTSGREHAVRLFSWDGLAKQASSLFLQR